MPITPSEEAECPRPWRGLQAQTGPCERKGGQEDMQMNGGWVRGSKVGKCTAPAGKQVPGCMDPWQAMAGGQENRQMRGLAHGRKGETDLYTSERSAEWVDGCSQPKKP